jgi:hypothetical protein
MLRRRGRRDASLTKEDEMIAKFIWTQKRLPSDERPIGLFGNLLHPHWLEFDIPSVDIPSAY